MDRFEYANANCTGSVQHVVNLNSFGCVSGQDGSYSGLVIPPNTYFQFTSAPSGARPTYKSTAFPTATPVASTVSFSLQHVSLYLSLTHFELNDVDCSSSKGSRKLSSSSFRAPLPLPMYRLFPRRSAASLSTSSSKLLVISRINPSSSSLSSLFTRRSYLLMTAVLLPKVPYF